jgi:EAL domain-containing protein (putative c-di-GMP-specific phosphodiesterase class I)
MSGCMLDKILAPNGLRPYSQLIVNVSEHRCQVASLECLSRGPKGTPFESPTVLFDYARQRNAESVVDGHAIEIALDALRLLPPRIGISVNVHASTLGRDPGFVDRLVEVAGRNQIECSRITIEIVEHSPLIPLGSYPSTLTTSGCLMMLVHPHSNPCHSPSFGLLSFRN